MMLGDARTRAADMGEAIDTAFTGIGEPPAWHAAAACRGTDASIDWFPTRGAQTEPAKRVCRGCAVRLECLNYAIVNIEKFGVWGGLSERERRRIRRQRTAATGPDPDDEEPAA